MAFQTLDLFTQASAKPGPFSLFFLRDPDLGSTKSRAFAFHFVMEHLQDTLAVEDALENDPTAVSPLRGEQWIVGASATGAWATHDNELALWDGSAWLFATASEGWRFYSKEQNRHYLFNGTVWLTPGPKAGDSSVADAASEKVITFGTAFPDVNYTPLVTGIAGVSLFRIKTGTIAATGFTVQRLDTLAQVLETSGVELFSWAAIPHEDL